MAFNLNKFLNTVSSTVNTIGTVVNTANLVKSFVQNPFGDITNAAAFMSGTRLADLPFGAEYTENANSYSSFSASSASTGSDWRVRLHLPTEISSFRGSIFTPLINSNNSMVFPTTPQIILSHAANYNSLTPVHTNYPYPVYQNSQVEDINITCEWPVENEADGRYWIAAVQFLRSVTKMFYGTSPNRGAPPPVTHLSGYGDFIFNRVPVVVKLFTMDLGDSVDYIKVPISGSSNSSLSQIPEIASTSGSYTYVPVLSRLTVSVQPAFSRTETSKFNLDRFAQGGYIGRQSQPGGFL
jgi:hypothetical protein